MRGGIRTASVVLLGLALSSFLLAGYASAQDLNLKEANVVGVNYSGDGGGYDFDVTLYHDDDGEPGYADWWQVESLDGEKLGRRTLMHPHGTREFTRSATVDIPSGTQVVVVQGHDETHGYGGRAIILNLSSGEIEAVMQGPEPMDLSGASVRSASTVTPSPAETEAEDEGDSTGTENAEMEGTDASTPTGKSGGEAASGRDGRGEETPNGSVPGFGAALAGIAVAVALASKK